MDNMNQKEAKWQAWLASSYKDYLVAVVCYCVGFFIFVWGSSASSDKILFLGYLIMGAPVFLRMLASRTVGALFFWRDYEVITTHSDGRKTSDGGAESAWLQLIFWFFMLCFCLVIGGIIAFLRLVWLTVKSIICYLIVKEKPTFLHSPFFILIVGLVGLMLCALPPKIVDARKEKAKTELNEFLANPVGSTAVVSAPTLKLRTKPSGNSSVKKTLNKDDTLTVTDTLSDMWLPVEQAGVTGWVYAPFVQLKRKKDLISPILKDKFPYQGILSASMRATEPSNSNTITLKKGAEVKVCDCYAKGTPYCFIEYNEVLYRLIDGYNAELIVPKK